MCLLVPPALAQDCDNAIDTLSPASRFVVKTDETVVDKATALMWKRCSEGLAGPSCAGSLENYTWPAALLRAQSVNNAGFAAHKDWRVPNIKELQSLLEIQCTDPTINLDVFPGTLATDYWSSSSILVDGLDDNAWFMDFHLGQSNFSASRSELKALRLVRDLP